MRQEDELYQSYVSILKEELVPAMGCTEPIAVAYCAAKARDVLGGLPERVSLEVSGNIIKNVKSVVVPNTGGLHGIEAAVAAGLIGGSAERALEVIAEMSGEQKAELREFLARCPITVRPSSGEDVLDIAMTLEGDGHCAFVRISGRHTNIVEIRRDREVLYQAVQPETEGKTPSGTKRADGRRTVFADRSRLTVEEIVAFADALAPSDGRMLFDRQIACNTAIAEEGLRGSYGANVGSLLLRQGNDVRTRAKAWAAAGSDARMSGCELPVVINSGSGNQGMAASLPVIVYARELGSGEEKLYRALAVSNLITIHQKSGIGRLSAYCGAISAGCGAGCGIAYLQDGGYPAVAHTLVNSLAIVSGIVCDGAKASCAAKIAAAVDAGIFGYEMYVGGQQFYGGDGLVTKGVENTLRNISRLGKIGMKETDREIIRIMTGC